MTGDRGDQLNNARRALFERLDWSVAERDDARVASVVAQHDEFDDIFSLDQAGLLDGFMDFLGDVGFLSHLNLYAPEHRQRVMVPAALILLTYMTKTLLGIEHMYAMPELLFTDPAVMKLLGFNARWLDEGLCQRSHEKRDPGKEPPKPCSAQMIANFLAGLPIKKSLDLYQAAIRCLAKSGFFPSELTLIIDGSDVETTSKCDGAGRATRKKKITNKNGRVREIEVTVHGFKVIAAFELFTQIPVGIVVTKIERNETKSTKQLIEQVQRNFADTSSRITQIVMDRGFLDGEALWWLHTQDIAFVVPSKSNMLITTEARLYASDGRGYEDRRIDKKVRGRGKNRLVEEKDTHVVGVENLRFLDSFNAPEKAAKSTRRGYKSEPLQAVVVYSWNGHASKPGEEPVLLTNMSVQKPLRIQEQYRNRSIIENTLFREGKQAWTLENIPQKNEQAAVAHISITFMMVALTTAYRVRREQEEEEEESLTLDERLSTSTESAPKGVRRWRREQEKSYKDYVIVFCGDVYGIFHVAEFSVLSGHRIKKLPEFLGDRDAIFARYGMAPP